MARKFPPFASVRAFEAAARHCSFKNAGTELILTPSAISHQVKSLEDFLGVQLFFRRRNDLVLTDAGQLYLGDLTAVLDDFEAITERIISRREKNNLTINLFPSLASNWLMSRIPSLREQHPDINVKFMTSVEPLDFKSSDIDLAIRYYKKNDLKNEIKPEYMADLLFDETIIPVCSKQYLEEAGALSETRDILNHSLIFCDTEPDEWPHWCKTVDIVYQYPNQCINVDTRALALKAAMDNLGIAIGRTPFHGDYISRGRLVTPLPFDFATGYAYYLVYPERNKQMPSIRRFREWILETSSPYSIGKQR